jgi:Competence protein CoiA-like family
MLVAKRVSDNAEVIASEVDRGPEFRCPDPVCNQVVFIRKGRKRIHHFAHRPDASCAYGRGETQAHLLAKLFLRNEFRRRGFQADVERVVLSSESDRRADVLVSKPNTDRRMAIEVQHSNLSVLDIERRTKAYMAAGVPVIWIGLMNWGLLGIGDRSLNGYYVMNYRSRDWEKWAHNYNGGHLWLLDVNVSGGEMWRASFQGGATILEGPFGIQSLHIKFFKRMRSLHGRIIPVAYGAWLLAPKEDKPPSLPIPKFSMPRPQPALPPLWWQTKRLRGGRDYEGMHAANLADHRPFLAGMADRFHCPC